MHNILLSLVSEVRGALRFRRVALLVAWIVSACGWIAALSIPSVYEASSRVYLNTQSALRPLLEGLAIAPNIASDLDAVRQAMTSGPAAEKIALSVGIDLASQNAKNREAALAGFKNNIEVTRASSEGKTDGIYRIAFRSTNRVQSLNVVTQLLDLFVNGTLGNKRVDQEKTSRFLDDQIADYEKRLTNAEERLAQFQKANIGRMPTDKVGYFSRLQTEMDGLNQASAALSVAEARRAELDRQLSGEEPYLFGLDNDSVGSQSAASSDVAVRMHELEKRREDLLLRFTPKHPEIVGLDKQLTELKRRQDAELQRVHAGMPATGDLSASLKSNPVYQSLQVQAKQSAVQVAEFRRDRDLRSSRVGELRKMVNQVPEVEAELTRLNRDYEATNSYYRRLLQSRETAKMSTEADNTGTVNFKEIDPPVVSMTPVSPKRPLLLLAVLALGLGAGVATAVLLNLLQPVYFDWETLGNSTGLPVIGRVRFFNKTDPQHSGMRPYLPAIAATGGLLVACFLLIVLADRSSMLVRSLLGAVSFA